MSLLFGADGGTRTRTSIRTLAPQASQSTSSSTSAYSALKRHFVIIAVENRFVNRLFSTAGEAGRPLLRNEAQRRADQNGSSRPDECPTAPTHLAA